MEFRFAQQKKQQEKRNQREGKENRAALPVYGRIDHIVTDADTQFRDDKNAEAIPHNGQRKHHDHQQERVSSPNARTNVPPAAAVMSNTMVECMPLHSGATMIEKPGRFSVRSSRKTGMNAAFRKRGGRNRGGLLEKRHSVQSSIGGRHRNHEKQGTRGGKQMTRVKRRSQRTSGNPPPQTRHRQPSSGSDASSVCGFHPNAPPRSSRSERRIRPAPPARPHFQDTPACVGHLRPFQPDQIQADERDQRNVGKKFVMQRVLQERVEREGKTGGQPPGRDKQLCPGQTTLLCGRNGGVLLIEIMCVVRL